MWAAQLLIITSNGQVTFAEKPYIKINRFKKQKHWYLIHTWSDIALKGTIVNQKLSSLHEGSHEITLTVPLKFVVFSRGSCFTVIFHGLRHRAYEQKDKNHRACVVAPGPISEKNCLPWFTN